MTYSELYHHGIKGMKWGVRRYQNKDGSLTEAGKKRITKQLVKEYKKDYNSAQPFRTSDKFDQTTKELVKNTIRKSDIDNVRAAKKKFLDVADESDAAEQKLMDLARKIGTKEFEKEYKKHPEYFPDEKSKDMALDSYIFEDGYAEAQRRNPDLVAKTNATEQAYRNYQEECKKVADRVLDSYGDTKLYDCEWYSYSVRDAVGSMIDSMEHLNEFDKLFKH